MSTSNQSTIRILAFAGSLRKDSYNKAVLRAAKKLASPSLNIQIFELAGIPLYNADVEAQGDPERVAEFKEAISNSDGLLIATPCPQPEILVYRAHEKFDDEGNLTDEATKKYLQKYLEALYQWVLRFVS